MCQDVVLRSISLMFSRKILRNLRLCAWLTVMLIVASSPDCSPLCADEQSAAPATGLVDGIQVPAGFHVELYADDDLAHDVHSMTIDSKGRVVVSGPGYIRILVDSDNDGHADTFTEFADKPGTGSQGMFFLGSSLLCSGDQGLQIFRDDNQDDVADGPPQVFLKISAGGEHQVHSIQKGPEIGRASCRERVCSVV